MALVEGIETKTVKFDIDKTQALKALAQELNVYEYFKNQTNGYYKVEDEKIYYFYDISYHGSPYYEKTLCNDNKTAARNYELISELCKLNNIRLEWY